MLARIQRWQREGSLISRLVQQTTVAANADGNVVITPPAWLQRYVVNHEEVLDHLTRVIMLNVHDRLHDDKENQDPRLVA